ncbi:hypothetical protein RHO14_07045 [Orbus wheelerorum]|uniref:hypothetical protein n=1 Tax=Orbus wheelerorum TaxID=3074111 RepID=UPI00370D6F06
MWLPGILSLKNIEQINCHNFTVMPFFSNGKKYLTPVNAVDNLLSRVNGNDLVFCIMLTATTENSFVNKIQSLVDSWALPDFKKALRISKTLVNLDSNKMIIPAPDTSISSAPLSTQQSRAILTAQKIGQIKSLNISMMKSNISAFSSKQAQMIDNTKAIASSAGGAIIAVNYYFGLASDLKKDVPNETHSFTLLTGFTGSEIIKLLGLIA